jgi:RNA polymerase sigma-70 factor (ECF subfamily)
MAGPATTLPGGGTAGGDQWDPADPEQDRMAALLVLAQQGDGEAFGQIYDRYVDSVYRYLYYRVGSHPLAEDLTSETFLRALRRIDSFTWQGRDIGAWFVTIARNLVTDHFKSSRFRLEVTTADMLDADRADDGIEETVLDRLENAALLDAVRQLKPEQQECIVLRFLQGLSVAETAAVMKRSDGAVKQLQLRAVRALAKLLPEPAR